MPRIADTDRTKVRILLIDSAPANVEFVRLALSQAAETLFEVCWAGDLAAAFAHLRFETFDVALLNLSLPDCLGLESLQLLRQRCRNIPVVVLTSMADESTALKAVELGAQDFHVTGKVSAKALIRSLRFAIQRQKNTAATTQHRIELEAYGTLAAIVESAGDAIESWSPTGEIICWNEGATRLFGYAESEAIGRKASEFVSTDNSDEMQRILCAMRDAPSVRRWDAERIASDGRAVSVSMTLSPMMDREGRVYAVSVISRDVASAQRLEESVSQRELKQVAHVAAHDVKEQLRIVANAVLLLDRHGRDRLGEEGARYLQSADDGIKRMQTIIDELLNFTPLDLMNEPLESIDLRQTVKDAIRNLDFAVKRSGARIEVDALPRVLGNLNGLRMLFQELIVNAINFHRDCAPLIRVSSAAIDGGWEFAIADNGIQPESYDRVLSMFQRLYAAHESPSSGISLSRCRQIVESHGGRIWVESGPQAGCTIRFILPLDVPVISAMPVRRQNRPIHLREIQSA